MTVYKYDQRPYFFIPSGYITEGKINFLIFDSERKQNFVLPNKYLALIKNIANLSLPEALSKCNLDKEDFVKVVSFLIENDLIYFSDMVGFYKSIGNDFDYPAEITNAIIDIGDQNVFSREYIDNLVEINCLHLQIRYLRKVELVELEELVALLESCFLESVELGLADCSLIKEKDLVRIFNSKVYIEAVFCYNSNSNRLSSLLKNGSTQILYYTMQRLTIKSCGVVSSNYFTPTVKAFSESTLFNSCLNRKVSIDEEGNIKNCPSMKESYGNIKDTTLAEASEKPGFKKYWDINKDKIHVCKDCEFRYICTDCRAYVEDPDDILSKPLKCGYNPYTGEWSEWSTNPLKQKAIDFYGMREMVDEMDVSDSDAT